MKVLNDCHRLSCLRVDEETHRHVSSSSLNSESLQNNMQQTLINTTKCTFLRGGDESIYYLLLLALSSLNSDNDSSLLLFFVGLPVPDFKLERVHPKDRLHHTSRSRFWWSQYCTFVPAFPFPLWYVRRKTIIVIATLFLPKHDECPRFNPSNCLNGP